MSKNLKTPKKGAGETLRELYEKKRRQSKASDSLVEGLVKSEVNEKQQKRSAIKHDMEL